MNHCIKNNSPDTIPGDSFIVTYIYIKCDTGIYKRWIRYFQRENQFINITIRAIGFQGRAYAAKLSDGGVDLTHIEYPGMMHAFIPFYPLIKEGRVAIREISSFITKK